MGVASLRPKLMDWKSWWKCGTPRTEVDSEAEVDPLGSSWGHRQRQSEQSWKHPVRECTFPC